jgi:hypothetical protein
MAEFQLEIWRGELNAWEPHTRGEDPGKLKEAYRRSQWLSTAAWFEAFPGQSRGFRITLREKQRTLKAPRKLGKPRARNGSFAPIESQESMGHHYPGQAETYAAYLVKAYPEGPIPVRYWKHKGNGYASKALEELVKHLRLLGVEQSRLETIETDPAEHFAVEEETLDDDDQVNGPQSLRSCEHERATVTCGNCERSWCEGCDPAPAALCHFCHGRGHSIAEVAA